MRLSSIPLIAVLFVTAVASQRHMLSAADPVPSVSPESAGINPDRLNVIDDVVAEALSQEKMPGCVVLVGRSNGIVFHKAYGVLQSVPDRADMRPTQCLIWPL